MRNNVFADVKEDSVHAQTLASAEVIYLSFHKSLGRAFLFFAQKTLTLKNKGQILFWKLIFRSKSCFTTVEIHTTKSAIFVFFLSIGIACKHIFPCSLSVLHKYCTFPAAFSSIVYTQITAGYFRALGRF